MFACRGEAPDPARRGNGFTLIELVVALAIAALALAALPTGLSRLYENVEYRTTVRDLLSGLKAARAEAARSGMAVPFVVDVGERSFSVGERRAGTVPERLELSLIVAATEQAAERGSIRFYPDGSSTGGSIIVRRPTGVGVRLRVDWLLGRVSQEPLA
ncbi:MAG TPA: GspH/FimT family protein [Rhodocyclaceae bacterium]|nr:GspH/FimT family protein [Rhodocyclaceae bacterium]